MVGGDVCKWVAGNGTDRTAVYQNVDNMVAGIRGDGVGLAGTLVERCDPIRVDGSACTCGCRDGVGGYRDQLECDGDCFIAVHTDGVGKSG